MTDADISAGRHEPLFSNQRDVGVIGLIGLAHGTSHFFHLLLPPLFPVFASEFGLSFTQMGLLVTAFFLVSGTGQVLSGFLVDKVGAYRVLLCALLCFVGAATVAALAGGWWGLLGAAVLAGIGNAPFHPADFSILNTCVSPKRLGHAYAVHGFVGNLGWALAPAVLVQGQALTGSWRGSYVVAALLALVVCLVLGWQRQFLVPVRPLDHAAPTQGGEVANRPETGHLLGFLKLPSVWLCFAFFFWSTGALGAIQSFSPLALAQLYGLALPETNALVTNFMLFGALGMVLGGFAVTHIVNLERTIAGALWFSALLLWWVGSGVVPSAWAVWLVALAGLGTGLAGPSRDMLIRQATPPGATGRVYGLVYCGLDLGFAVGAPIFGALMDKGQAAYVFYGAALALVLGLLSAVWVGTRSPSRPH